MRKHVFALVAAGLLAAIAATAIWHNQLQHAWFNMTGANNEPGKTYGFWSGFAGGLQVFQWTVLGILLYWQHTCHASPWCLRFGKYSAADGMFKLCGHHHPDHEQQDGESRLDMIHRLHREHKDRAHR